MKIEKNKTKNEKIIRRKGKEEPEEAPSIKE